MRTSRPEFLTLKRRTEMRTSRMHAKRSMRSLSAAGLGHVVSLGMSMGVSADEADAKRLLKAMSDYVAAQQAISFDYDSILEVITKDGQKLALASSAPSCSIDPTRYAPPAPAGMRMSRCPSTGRR